MNAKPLRIDHESMLANASGDATVDDIERALVARGLTLGLDPKAGVLERTVDAWLAEGAEGAPSAFSDPADHLVAGFEATLANGEKLAAHPSPRRATGPDLTALVVGARGRFAKIDSVWLRVHRSGTERVCTPLPDLDLDPPVSPEEARLLDAIADALTR